MTEVIVDAVLAFSLKKGDLCLRDCSADGRVIQYVLRAGSSGSGDHTGYSQKLFSQSRKAHHLDTIAISFTA